MLRFIVFGCALLCVPVGVRWDRAIAAEAPVPPAAISVQEPWCAVFGGKETVFHAAVNVQQSMDGTLGWSLSAGGHAVQRGESPVSAEPGRPITTAIRLRVPAPKEGVVFSMTLALSLAEKQGGKTVATLDRTLWAFSDDPFAYRKEWAKGLSLRLFDPEKKTAETLEKAGIPFQAIQNVDAIADLKDGLLLIGEKVSWKDYRGLPGLMLKAADRGVPVLCLAPGGGEMTVPGMGEAGESPKPDRFALRGRAIIAELDKRLDWVGWPPDGKVVTRSLKLQGERGPVVAAATEEDSGWPWLEMGFSGRKEAGRAHEARLVICGFAIVEKWNSGPAPRYLLARMLEYVSHDSGKQTEKQ